MVALSRLISRPCYRANIGALILCTAGLPLTNMGITIGPAADPSRKLA